MVQLRLRATPRRCYRGRRGAVTLIVGQGNLAALGYEMVRRGAMTATHEARVIQMPPYSTATSDSVWAALSVGGPMTTLVRARLRMYQC